MRRKPDDASPIRPRIRVGSPPLATSHRDTRRSCEEWPCRPTRAGGCEDRRRASAARLWDRDGKPLATLQGHTDWVTSAAFAPDGGRILTASDDRTARLWDPDGKPLAILQGHTFWVTSAVFAPDGGRILTASDDRTARLWDPDGKPLAIIQGHTFWVTSAVFAPDGGRILI
jgi:WD40 repeat protein